MQGLLGSVAAAQLTEGGPHFLADLGRLKGRRIALGDFVSELPAMQEQLFSRSIGPGTEAQPAAPRFGR